MVRLAAPVSDKAFLQIKILLAIAIASLVVGYWIARRLAISIITLVKEAKQVASGHYEKRVHAYESNEVSELSNYFNKITVELEKRIEELEKSKKTIQEVLGIVGEAMLSHKKIENILYLTVEVLVQAVEATCGVLWLKDKEGKVLRAKVSYGIKMKGRNVPIDKGVAGWVVRKGRALNIAEDPGDARFIEEKRLGLVKKTCLCVPLIFKENVIGAILIADKVTGSRFAEDDELLVANVAGQIAVAMENVRLEADVERNYIDTVRALALAVEAKDKYSHGHSSRITDYVTRVAKGMGLDEETIHNLRDAAMLHDLGKIGIKDEILSKTSELTTEERIIIQQHAIIGESILKPVHSLSNICFLVRHHQEKEDGTGYPDGITGTEMNLPLKILIVADAYDAMTTDRPYRKRMSQKEAFAELRNHCGDYFNKEVVDAFTKII